MTDTITRVRRIISEHLCLEEGKFTDDSDLSDMQADTLDRVEILMAIEDEFRIEISDEEAEANIAQDSTIATLAAYVDQVLAKTEEKIPAR